MVKSGPPSKTLGGEKELMTAVGFAASILKFIVAEASPFGPGFCTLTGVEPGIATSLAEMLAVSCMELTNVVVRLLPLHCTIAPEAKFEPFTVSVNAAPPAVALVGEIELIVGNGGGGGAAWPPPQPVIVEQRPSPSRVKTNKVFALMTCSFATPR